MDKIHFPNIIIIVISTFMDESREVLFDPRLLLCMGQAKTKCCQHAGNQSLYCLYP